MQAGVMSQELESIFRELGISQYLDTFAEQGFDSWETILDIQESDLDALGVKLGHRRKLQRRIANARGVAPGTLLASTTKPVDEISKQNSNRADNASLENGIDHPIVTKRKYRRHPKADENGPERPPSAYVLFSNKFREGLKGQTLTFTEIAKLVGENWQSLRPSEREKYETQANIAKERYHIQMASYKRSVEYHQYMRYLQEFKEKRGKPSQGQEPAKRPRLDQTQLTAENGTAAAESTAATGSAASIASGSSSERARESESGEPPSSRRHESVTSVTSATESRSSSAAPKPAASVPSPKATHGESATPKRCQQRHMRRVSSMRGGGRRADSTAQVLPPISALADSTRGFASSTDGHDFMTGFIPANQRHPLPSGPPGFASNPMPLIHHESSLSLSSLSSNGNGVPAEKLSSFGRRSSDAPLAIQALLSDQNAPLHHGYARSSSLTSAANPTEAGRPLFGQYQGHRGYGYQNPIVAFQHMKVEDSTHGDVLMTPVDRAPSIGGGDGRFRLDGMNALLRAGEIVGRFQR